MGKRIKTSRIIITLIITAVIFIAVFLFSRLPFTMYHSPEVKAVDGVIDLTEFNFNDNAAVRLDGEWEYYPDTFIAPGSFEKSNLNFKTLPETTSSIDPTIKKGTYHLTVKLAPGQERLAITIPQIFSDYHIIINQKAVESNGYFTGSHSVYPKSVMRRIITTEPVLDIVIFFRNNGYALPGIDGRFELGNIDNIDKLTKMRFALDLSFFVLPLFIGFYFIIIFAYERQFKKYLYFGLLCLAFSARMLLINEVVLLQLFPYIPFNIGYVIKSISVPAIFAGSIRIANEYSQKTIPPLLLRSSYIISITHALVLILFPFTVASYLTAVFILLMSLMVIIIAVFMFICAIQPNKKAIPAYSGFLVLSICIIHDCLAYMRMINGIHLLGYGFFIYIVIYSVLLAKSYSESYHHIQRLSEGLRLALDRAESTEAAYLNAQMKPHFLFNTLNTIAEYCSIDPKRAERLIIVLARFLRGTIDYGSDATTVDLKKELDHTREYTEILSARFPEIEFCYSIPSDLPPARIPPMILQPLIENCVNHGIRKREGSGCVDIVMRAEGDRILVLVEDDGAGITDERLDTILNYPPEETGRIGLYNVDQRLRREFGEGISIKTTVGLGTQMRFTLPVLSNKFENNVPKVGKND